MCSRNRNEFISFKVDDGPAIQKEEQVPIWGTSVCKNKISIIFYFHMGKWCSAFLCVVADKKNKEKGGAAVEKRRLPNRWTAKGRWPPTKAKPGVLKYSSPSIHLTQTHIHLSFVALGLKWVMADSQPLTRPVCAHVPSLCLLFSFLGLALEIEGSC